MVGGSCLHHKRFLQSSILMRDQSGQASVEAAVLLPTMMLLLALLLQPVFLLYTRSVMQQAASEGIRTLMTCENAGEVSQEACKSYIKRRLSAVPNVSAFHKGGAEGWSVEIEGDSSTSKVSVCVEGKLRPLPLVGVLAQMLGEVQGDEILIKVKVNQTARPSWLSGSYSSWASEWE